MNASPAPPIQSVRWSPDGRAVRIIDQRRLPLEYHERDLRTADDVCEAIRTLAVRGAPAIGICGAMGLVAALGEPTGSRQALLDHAEALATRIAATRPTAVNLRWATDRIRQRARDTDGDVGAVMAAVRTEATDILEEDRAMCRRIGEWGVSLLRPGARILTHCNAGALATGGIGTALAPVYVAAERGVPVEVVAAETRPLMQGSRLTAWELGRAGIPVTLITDSTAATLFSSGAVDLCLVGADRIAGNGDVANKIGTYGLAILARHHRIPFYVAAPASTVDPGTASGDHIPIEQRDPGEVTTSGGAPVAPVGVRAMNPAFDITPAALVTAIVTDRGIVEPPFDFSSWHADGPAPGAR